MAHSLIIGRTESGKTTLAKALVRQYRERHGIQSIVLDPIRDPSWGAQLVTDNAEQFLDVCKRSRRCALFIDEGGQSIGRYNKEMEWLATQARHWGHASHFIVHRNACISKTIRDQCSKKFIFRISRSDAKEYADDDGDILLEAASLMKGQYFYCPTYGDIKKKRIF